MSLAIALAATTAFAGATAGQKCEATKNGVSGKYVQCLHAAYAKYATSGVGPDTTKCDAAFLKAWDAAEIKGGGSCPDLSGSLAMAGYLAGQAARTTAIINGPTAIPACGDGSINRVGEQCDGSDFGGTSCSSLGYGGGTLACDGTCRFNAAGCGPCPDGTVSVGDDCWVLSESDGSCTAACADRGMTCVEASVVAVGSGGSDAACGNIMDLLAPYGAPWTASTYNQTGCGTPAGNSIGCVLQRGFNLVKRVVHSGPTNCDAGNDGPLCFLGASPERACACQ